MQMPRAKNNLKQESKQQNKKWILLKHWLILIPRNSIQTD